MDKWSMSKDGVPPVGEGHRVIFITDAPMRTTYTPVPRALRSSRSSPP